MGETVLHGTITSGCVELAAQLLAVKPELIDRVDLKGATVLHCAVAEMLLAVKPELVSCCGRMQLHHIARCFSAARVFRGVYRKAVVIDPKCIACRDQPRERGRHPSHAGQVGVR